MRIFFKLLQSDLMSNEKELSVLSEEALTKFAFAQYETADIIV